MQPELIAIFVRGIVIVLTTLAGILCIFLGWRLYFENIRAQARFEASAGGNKLTLQSSAPGIFFVAFGAALLIYVINTKVEFEEVQGRPPIKPANAAHFIKSTGATGEPVQTSHPRFLLTQSKDPQVQPQQAPDITCLYKSRKLKWFDDDDQRTERQQILDTLKATRAILLNQLARGDSRAEEIRRHALVLEQLEIGFKP